MSKIHEAISQNNFEDFEKLLKIHQKDINITDFSKQTPLHIAVREKQNKNVVKLLLEFGAEINLKCGKQDWTPLHHASNIPENTEIVKTLIENGADVNSTNKKRLTPLHAAIVPRNNVETVKILLQNGANVNVKDGENVPLLHSVVKNGNTEVLQLFIEHNVDLNSRDNYNLTALHIAASARTKRKKEILKLLLEKGADLNVSQSNRNMTPITIAIESGEISNVELILDYYMKIDYLPRHIFIFLINGIPQIDKNPMVKSMKKSLNLLFRHLIKLKMLNFWHDDVDLYSLIPKPEDLMEYENVCEKEICRLNEEIAQTHRITYLDLLLNSVSKITIKLKSEDLQKNLSKTDLNEMFPVYGNFVKIRIKKCLEIVEFINNCLRSLGFIFLKYEVPIEIFEDILKLLTEEDKRNLVNAVKIK